MRTASMAELLFDAQSGIGSPMGARKSKQQRLSSSGLKRTSSIAQLLLSAASGSNLLATTAVDGRPSRSKSSRQERSSSLAKLLANSNSSSVGESVEGGGVVGEDGDGGGVASVIDLDTEDWDLTRIGDTCNDTKDFNDPQEVRHQAVRRESETSKRMRVAQLLLSSDSIQGNGMGKHVII